MCAADAASAIGCTEELAPLVDGATLLASRAESLAAALVLRDAVSSRWAVRRLLGSSMGTPALDRRVAPLPFDFFPAQSALPLPHTHCALLPSMPALLPELDVSSLRVSVPFEQAELRTADGRTVRERRHTAWLADEGIGALAYSGKLMSPTALDASPTVCPLSRGR